MKYNNTINMRDNPHSTHTYDSTRFEIFKRKVNYVKTKSHTPC
jgi:hypothetical protein